LRAARERAGITLEAIAASTKINRSLLAALEENDLAHWPAGIFRRAFFRSYLDAIGLQSESLVADFVRLFPESGAKSGEDLVTHFDGPESELRLTLVDTGLSGSSRFLQQFAAASSDLCAVIVLTAGTVGLFQFALWPSVAAISLAYGFGSVAWLGRTPGAWWLATDRPTSKRRASVHVLVEPLSLRIVARQQHVSLDRSADAKTSVA
jgi:hypothetical protein